MTQNEIYPSSCTENTTGVLSWKPSQHLTPPQYPINRVGRTSGTSVARASWPWPRVAVEVRWPGVVRRVVGESAASSAATKPRLRGGMNKMKFLPVLWVIVFVFVFVLFMDDQATVKAPRLRRIQSFPRTIPFSASKTDISRRDNVGLLPMILRAALSLPSTSAFPPGPTLS